MRYPVDSVEIRWKEIWVFWVLTSDSMKRSTMDWYHSYMAHWFTSFILNFLANWQFFRFSDGFSEIHYRGKRHKKIANEYWILIHHQIVSSQQFRYLNWKYLFHIVEMCKALPIKQFQLAEVCTSSSAPFYKYYRLNADPQSLSILFNTSAPYAFLTDLKRYPAPQSY